MVGAHSNNNNKHLPILSYRSNGCVRHARLSGAILRVYSAGRTLVRKIGILVGGGGASRGGFRTTPSLQLYEVAEALTYRLLEQSLWLNKSSMFVIKCTLQRFAC